MGEMQLKVSRKENVTTEKENTCQFKSYYFHSYVLSPNMGKPEHLW